MSGPGSRRRRPRTSRLRSCDHCLAWGMLTERLCKACRSFAGTHPMATCATCGRGLPVDAGVCRPCRKQASLIAGPANKTTLDLSTAGVTGHQLRFYFGTLARAERWQADALPETVPPRPVRLGSRWVQLLLCDVPRDLSLVSAQLPPIDAGLAQRLHAEAHRLADPRPDLGYVRLTIRIGCWSKRLRTRSRPGIPGWAQVDPGAR